MNNLVCKLQDIYTNGFEDRKKIKKGLIISVILVSIYHLINAFTNYDFDYFLLKELFLSIYVSCIILIFKAFHALFGKWIIHATKEKLSIEYVKHKMPRKFKTDGDTGACTAMKK